jgi:hypothetical protein
MRTIEEYWLVCALHAQGLSQAEIARRTRIARATVRQWLEDPPAWIAHHDERSSWCPQCAAVEHAQGVSPSYAYLLGLYLGDGTISRAPRGVFKLRIFLDQRYSNLNAECAGAMGVVVRRRVGIQQRVGCLEIHTHSKHLPCLFPQVGPGMKHTRPIELVPWQQDIAGAHPDRLLRGLIHSDGCRVTNRVTVRGRRYQYPRYFFTNESSDIRAIFTSACDRLGVAWRQNRRNSISVARREAVALLDQWIGPKT